MPAGIHPQLVQDPSLKYLRWILAFSKGLAEDQLPEFPLGTFCHEVKISSLGLYRFLANDNILILNQQDTGCELVSLGVVERHRSPEIIDPGDSRVGGAKVDADSWYG